MAHSLLRAASRRKPIPSGASGGSARCAVQVSRPEAAEPHQAISGFPQRNCPDCDRL